MSSNMFVPTGDVIRILRSNPSQRNLPGAHVFSVNHAQVMYLYKISLLPCLSVGGNPRLGVREYVEAYAKFLSDEWLDAIPESARLFAVTKAAQRLDREAEPRFLSRLRLKDEFSASELASLLCVSDRTVKEWIQRKVLKATRELAIHGQPYTISSDAIREICKWSHIRTDT